jgi:hypothetical protein
MTRRRSGGRAEKNPEIRHHLVVHQQHRNFSGQGWDNMIRWVLLLVIAVVAFAAWNKKPASDAAVAGPSSQQPLKTYTLTEVDTGYSEAVLHGWRVLVSKQLLAQDGALALQVLNLLDAQLNTIQSKVPLKAVQALQAAPIWLELQTPGLRGAQYHWSADWLSSNGYDPRKARAVEIASARDYLEWSQLQPSIILHELAHAYHDRVLGKDHPELLSAFNSAGNRGLYESVASAQGPVGRAYALNNYLEFFAELTEAYFVRNDFFPFTRDELRQYDTVGYAMIESVWNQ